MSKKFILIGCIGIFLMIIISYEVMKNSDNNEVKEISKTRMSYEEFEKEYSEFNLDKEDIREDNYYLFEDELFSRKFSKYLKCEIIKVNKDIFLLLNNTSDEYFGSIRTTIIFYDDNNQIIDIDTEYTGEIEYGGKSIKSLRKLPSEYARVDFFNEIDKPKSIPSLRVSNIKCELINEENSNSLKITNNNKEHCERIYGNVFFYDEFGNITDCSYFYLSDWLNSEESKNVGLYNFPNSFANYECIISSIR